MITYAYAIILIETIGIVSAIHKPKDVKPKHIDLFVLFQCET